MPATIGIGAVSIAGKARSDAARVSLFVVPRLRRGRFAVTRHEFARRRRLVFSRKASLVGLRDTPANPTYALRVDGNHNIF